MFVYLCCHSACHTIVREGFSTFRGMSSTFTTWPHTSVCAEGTRFGSCILTHGQCAYGSGCRYVLRHLATLRQWPSTNGVDAAAWSASTGVATTGDTAPASTILPEAAGSAAPRHPPRKLGAGGAGPSGVAALVRPATPGPLASAIPPVARRPGASPNNSRCPCHSPTRLSERPAPEVSSCSAWPGPVPATAWCSTGTGVQLANVGFPSSGI